MPGPFELKPTLTKIWHAPDNFRLMDPLPPLHRRGIIIGALMVIVGFLLPGADDSATTPVRRDAELDFRSQTQPQPDTQPMQTQLVSPTNDPGQMAPVEPEPSQDEQPQEQAAEEKEKRRAQLFRDHNLPPTDVYAMAQVEGAGKPLSNLQNGQMVQIRQNASGVVTGLTIDSGNGQQVLFTRQADGSFVRAK